MANAQKQTSLSPLSLRSGSLQATKCPAECGRTFGRSAFEYLKEHLNEHSTGALAINNQVSWGSYVDQHRLQKCEGCGNLFKNLKLHTACKVRIQVVPQQEREVSGVSSDVEGGEAEEVEAALDTNPFENSAALDREIPSFSRHDEAQPTQASSQGGSQESASLTSEANESNDQDEVPEDGSLDGISLDEIVNLDRPVLQFVPKPHRQLFGTILARLIRDAYASNTLSSWKKLLMFVKCVLPAAERGREKKLENMPAHLNIELLLKQWMSPQGPRQLWQLAKEKCKGKMRAQVSEKNPAQLAKSHVQRGSNLRRAMRALTSKGKAPINEATAKKLAEKLPQLPEDRQPSADFAEPLYAKPLQLPINDESCFKMLVILRSFDKNVGVDQALINPTHLMNATEAKLPSSIQYHLVKLINHILAGKVVTEVTPYLAGGKMVALKKGEADVRPIIMGNVFRRIAAKAACVEKKEDFVKFFASLQFGLTKAGCERIIHELRATLDGLPEESDLVTLLIDLENAFNVVSRQRILEQVAEHFPDLYAFVSWCIETQSYVAWDNGAFLSAQGVPQGDPLGPFLFCLVLQVLVKSIEKKCPNLVLNKWFMDDGTIVGSAKEVNTVIDIIVSEGPELGLFFSTKKSRVCSLSQKALQEVNSIDQSHKSQHFNFVQLGSPFGDAEFCTNFVSDIANKVKTEIHDKLVSLCDPQISMLLLRQCASFCKIVYIARTTPPHLVQHAFEDFDKQVMGAIQSCLQLKFDENAYAQAKLSTGNGGLGLRAAADHCEAAFVASASFASSVDPTLKKALKAERPGRNFNMALSALNSKLQEDGKGPLDGADLLEFPKRQETLSGRLETIAYCNLRSNQDEHGQARLDSLNAPNASAWLDARPVFGPVNLVLQPDEVQVLVKHRLGMPLCEEGDRCRVCKKKAPLDPNGHHALTCMTGGDVIVRHNRVRDVLLKFCKAAKLKAWREQGCHGSNKTRPADILLNAPGINEDKLLAIDVSIVSPHTIANMKVAGNKGGRNGAVAVQENVKLEGNKEACAKLEWEVVPFVCDSYGCWGKHSDRVFQNLSVNLSIQNGESRFATLPALYSTLGVTLMRQQALAMLAKTTKPSIFGRQEVSLLSPSTLAQGFSHGNSQNTRNPTPSFTSSLPRPPRSSSKKSTTPSLRQSQSGSGKQVVPSLYSPRVSSPLPDSLRRDVTGAKKALQVRATALGCHIVDNAGGGNCFYRALAHLYYGDENRYQGIKQALADFAFSKQPELMGLLFGAVIPVGGGDSLLPLAGRFSAMITNVLAEGVFNSEDTYALAERWVAEVAGFSGRDKAEIQLVSYKVATNGANAIVVSGERGVSSSWRLGNIDNYHWVVLAPGLHSVFY